MLVAGRARGEGEFPKRQEAYLGTCCRSASMLHLCHGELAGRQAAPRVLGKGNKQRVFGCMHQKADTSICAAARHPPVLLSRVSFGSCVHLTPSTCTYNLLAQLWLRQIQCPK